MLYATRQYIQMITSALSQETGVRIQESNKWAADPDGNILYYDLESLKYLPFMVARGILLHEISHLLHTKNPTPSKKWRDKYSIASLHNIYNAYEDIRIEKLIVDKYGYFVQHSLKGSLLYILEKNLYNGIDKMSRMDQFLFLSIYEHHVKYNTHGINDYYEISNILSSGFQIYRLSDVINPTGPLFIDKDVHERYWDNIGEVDDVIKQIIRAPKTQKVVDIIDTRLISLVEDFLEEDSKERQEQEQQAGEQDSQQKKQRINLSDLAEDKDGQLQERLQSGFQHTDDKKYLEKPTEQEAIALLNPYIVTLTQRLQSILQEKAHTKWRGAYQSGKLLNKHAYKVTIPDETRMFSKKTTPDNPHYHVWIALDASGSMSDEQRGLYAYLGAILLKRVLQNLKCKVTLLQFHDEAKIVQDIEKEYQWNGGGTQDASALRLINKDIRPEEDNLIFFLTDGETDLYQREEELDKLVHRYHAQVFGIGIGSDISKEILIKNYPHGLQVSEVQLLPQALIGLIRSVIKR